MTSPTIEFQAVALLGFADDSELATALTGSGRRVVVAERPEGDLLAGVDLVIESGRGDLDAAKALLAEAAGLVGPEVPLLTASSTYSVTDLAAALPEPGRVAGLHLLETGPGRGTVEVVPALQSAANLTERLVGLVESLAEKVAVVVKDRPGLLLNTLFLPYLNDVIAELDDGLATAEDIDLALQLGLGYRVGPFELLDRAGLDVHLATTQAIYESTGDTRYAPPPLLRQLVAAGRLGEKTGSGFRTTTN